MMKEVKDYIIMLSVGFIIGEIIFNVVGLSFQTFVLDVGCCLLFNIVYTNYMRKNNKNV